MIFGIGCDIVDVSRIKKAIANERFVNRVFAEKEIVYCAERGEQAAQSFAARFAAKEAFLKALGTGLREGKLTDICVVNDELGKPELLLSGTFGEMVEAKGIKHLHLTLSHTKDVATAYVVLEG